MTTPSPASALTRDTAAEPGDVRAIVGRLTLDDKVRLLTGSTPWRLHALPEAGLRSIALSDGPVGVRGLGEIPGETSVLFPAPSAVGATWDPELAHRLGRAFAREARAHGVDVVLAPQVNIQRTPVGGRHFECYSEDPLVTSTIATAIVRGVQELGVGACVKHFIANDSETERTSYLVRMDAQALREVYLAPFEHVVRDGGVWMAMAAYNGVDDGREAAPMTDHHGLLTDLLKGELGFDGVVVSDWMATQSTVGAALGGLDLVMPGPGGPWEDALLDAVRDGRVPEDVIDDKVARILLLGRRVGALDEPALEAGPGDDPRELATAVAAASTVVLKRAALPVWNRPAPLRVALIGPNAVRPHVLGGGSSTVHAAHVVSPEEGIRARFPDATVTVRRGGDSRRYAPELDLAAHGAVLTATILTASGTELRTVELSSWDGWLRDLPDAAHRVRLSADVELSEPGEHWLEVGTVGGHAIRIDGETVATDDVPAGVEVILDSSINTPPGWGATVVVDQPRRVTIESEHLVIRAGGYGAIVRAALRHLPPGADGETELRDAVKAAADADLVVVIVGTNEEVESEGWDRTSLALPGRQDELVEAVLDVAPDAIVVVNAGAPVVLPWLERAQTVLWTWFPGQEAGHALAAVLAGDREAAGRLPWTLPGFEVDVPVPHARPNRDGVLEYHEGIHVGYRGWEREGLVPAAPFGSGLGWTTWSYDAVAPVVADPDGDTVVEVVVTNTGERAGREVVQCYLEPPAGAHPERPVRWLAGFTNVDIAAGETRRVVVTIPGRSFQAWDVARERWTTVAGTYRLRVGRSIGELVLDTAVHVEPEFRER